MRTRDGKRRVAEALSLAARILWHLLKFREPFNPAVFAQDEENLKRRHHSANALGCSLVSQQ